MAAVRIVSLLGGLCWMGKMTNSAAFTGAMPFTPMSRPLSLSPWVMVVRSHFAENASTWVVPCSAGAPDRI